jgi:hypothetical protein
VVVDGGALKGRLSAAEAAQAKEALSAARIQVKKGFFSAATEEGELREEDDLFDRSSERMAEEAERAARRAAVAEAARLAQSRALLPGRKAVAIEEVRAPVSRVIAEEEDEDEEVEVAAAGAGGEVVRKAAPSGMNRAERRAAAQAAAELAEAAAAFARSKAEDEAYMRQLENGIGGAVWSDDEVDVDAI